MKTFVILLVIQAAFQVKISEVAARSIRQAPDPLPAEETSEPPEAANEEDEADVSSETDSSELTPEDEACLEELHLDKQMILELAGGDIFPDDNEDFNKFVSCSWQKVELQDGDGKVDYDKLASTLTDMAVDEFKSVIKKKMTSAVKWCKDNPPPMGNTPGQTAVRIQNCISFRLSEIFYD